MHCKSIFRLNEHLPYEAFLNINWFKTKINTVVEHTNNAHNPVTKDKASAVFVYWHWAIYKG